MTSLFASSLYKLDLSLVPQVGQLRRQLGVQRGPLTIWKPQLEVRGLDHAGLGWLDMERDAASGGQGRLHQ